MYRKVTGMAPTVLELLNKMTDVLQRRYLFKASATSIEPCHHAQSVQADSFNTILMSINKCALNFLLFLAACYTEDQYIWYHALAENLL